MQSHANTCMQSHAKKNINNNINLLEKIYNERHLHVPMHVDRIDGNHLTSVEFIRNYVEKNVPVIITNVKEIVNNNGNNNNNNNKNNNNEDKGKPEDVLHVLGSVKNMVSFIGAETEISVNSTPSGFADSLYHLDDYNKNNTDGTGNKEGKTLFLKPLEFKTTLGEATNMMEKQRIHWKNNRYQWLGDCLNEEEEKELQLFNHPIMLDTSTHNQTRPPVFSSMIVDADADVWYISRQNSNLVDDFTKIITDKVISRTGIKFFTEALDREPEAINLWCGDGRSVTSMHKDPYENIYLVTSGQKRFTLLPPISYLKFKEMNAISVGINATLTKKSQSNSNSNNNNDNGMNGVWSYTIDATSNIDKEEDEEEDDQEDDINNLNNNDNHDPNLVPWISIDPDTPPYNTELEPLKCVINPGEILYLPAFWYHKVAQSDETIAVNYWYDFDYSRPFFSYYQLFVDLVDATHPDNNAFQE